MTAGPMDSRTPLLTPARIAEQLGLDRSTVYRALEERQLRGFKVGGGPKAPWRVRVEDVEEWAGFSVTPLRTGRTTTELNATVDA